MKQLSLIPSEEESEKLLNLLSLMGVPVQGHSLKWIFYELL